MPYYYATFTFPMLSEELLQIIRAASPIAEKNKQLTDAQLNIIYKQQWFKLLVPAVYGGLEWPLPDVVKLEEAISYADGSMGWVVTLCTGAGWFGGFIDPSFAAQIFSNNKVCLAGSGAPTGTAEKTDKGYIINGRWLHASGAPQATIFTANCYITKQGQQIKDEEGNDLILSFAFLNDEVTILPTWNCMGMIATASNAYEISNLHVGPERSFKIDAASAHINNPLYRYPFMQLAEVTLAANMSGMALHFMALCENILVTKSRQGTLLINIPSIKEIYTQAQNCLNTARAAMYEALQLSWCECTADRAIADEMRKNVTTTAHAVVKAARQGVDNLYPFCGLSAADPSTEINRVWRDIHTAGQHALLALGNA